MIHSHFNGKRYPSILVIVTYREILEIDKIASRVWSSIVYFFDSHMDPYYCERNRQHCSAFPGKWSLILLIKAQNPGEDGQKVTKLIWKEIMSLIEPTPSNKFLFSSIYALVALHDQGLVHCWQTSRLPSIHFPIKWNIKPVCHLLHELAVQVWVASLLAMPINLITVFLAEFSQLPLVPSLLT